MWLAQNDDGNDDDDENNNEQGGDFQTKKIKNINFKKK